LHFGAFVAAVVSLILLACVLKFRRQPPPQSVTWFAVIAALLAIGTTFLY
jgi:outer membrane biogenesis lipoprotein LolB